MINLSIIGNVGSEPELRYTPDGKAVCNFSLASTHRWNDDKGEKHEQTTWFKVTCWGKLAEITKQYLNKGRQVYVQASRITADAWNDKTSGEARAALDVTANTVQFLGSKGDQAGETNGDSAPAEQSENEKPIF